MILHILPDDKFIVNFCTMAMEAGQGMEQVFMVRDKKPYKYLPDDAPYLVEAPFGSDKFNQLINSLGKGDRIIIHYLHPILREWLATTNTLATIEWVFWSSDFYNYMFYDYADKDKLNHAFVNQYHHQPLSRFLLLHWYRSYIRKRAYNRNVKAFNVMRDAAAKKISVFYHYIKEEHTLVEKMIPMQAEFRYFCYSQDVPFDEIYTLSKQLNVADAPINHREPNLLVGHSGYPYGNHLDSFEFLKNKVEGLKVIVPLSYGDEYYIKEVKQRGAAIFGAQFVPIVEYMNFSQYLTLLMACKGMFLDLSTPKAMGNLHTLLLLGKRVFIKRDMLAYDYFKRIGLKVNATDEFSKELLLKPEDPEVVARNISRIIEMHSYAKNYSFVKHMLQPVH